jgi:hypothetical protein
MRFLSHYCEDMKNDRTYITWDNNAKEDNLKDGAITLENLEIKILFYGTHDIDHLAKMLPQYTTNVDNRNVLYVTISTIAWGACS